MEIKIAVAYHKDSPRIESDVYMPLHVGKACNPELDLHMQTDAEGDNISAENYTYCELTGIYWLWKNVKADVKGLVHYRRFFGTDTPAGIRLKRGFHALLLHSHTPRVKCGPEMLRAQADKFADELPKLMSEYDVVVPQPCLCRPDVATEFNTIGKEYVDLLSRSVEYLYADYAETLRSMLKSHTMYYANMSVMKTEIFDDYCTFMFSILENVKRRLISDKYLIDLGSEKMFSRKLGYLGELLTNLYILYNQQNTGLKVKTKPVYMLQ